MYDDIDDVTNVCTQLYCLKTMQQSINDLLGY